MVDHRPPSSCRDTGGVERLVDFGRAGVADAVVAGMVKAERGAVREARLEREMSDPGTCWGAGIDGQPRAWPWDRTPVQVIHRVAI